MYQISARAKLWGRGLKPVAPVEGTPDPAIAGLVKWTVFVHGYNNNQVRASNVWQETVGQLDDCGVDLGAVVLFFWPGDYFKSRGLSALFYSKTIPIAVSAAERLAEYIIHASQRREIPLQLSFVAHSLGSLVVLETIKLLRNQAANVVVQDVLLMAAAVPEGFCVQGAEYPKPFSADSHEAVLFSPSDIVLANYFEVGQELAGRMPSDQTMAVGLAGGPDSGRGRRWEYAVHMHRFDHGDYWTAPKSVAEIAAVVEGSTAGGPVRLCEQMPRERILEHMIEHQLPWYTIKWDDAPSEDLISRWPARVVG